MDFYNRTKDCCERKGITLSEMVKILELSTGMPTKWKNGLIPNGETLIKISDFLEESIDFLLGRNGTKKEPTIIPYSGNEKVDSIVELLLNSSIDDNDLHIIEAVLDKYKR